MRDAGEGGANPEEEDPRNCPQPHMVPFIADSGELELSVICNTELQLTEARARDVIKKQDSREMLRGLRAERDCFSKELRSRWTC